MASTRCHQRAQLGVGGQHAMGATRSAAIARAGSASPGSCARRVRAELRAPPPGAAELGQAAQAGIRSRPGALPELRRRAEDHCGDPGAAGDREDPHPPGVAGAGTAPCAGPRSSAAGGLTIPTPHCSSGPARRAAGVGCVPVATGPMETAWRQGVNRRQCPERRFSGGPSTPNRSQPASKDRFERFGRCVPPRSAPVLPCSGCRRGGKWAFEKPIHPCLYTRTTAGRHSRRLS